MSEQWERIKIGFEMVLPGLLVASAVLELGGHFWAVFLSGLAVVVLHARLMLIEAHLEVQKAWRELQDAKAEAEEQA